MNPDSHASSSVTRALVLHADDNVATALCSLGKGEAVQTQGAGPGVAVTLCGPIALCHKFALRPIAAGEQVVKYGEPIGRAQYAIAAGEHVHTHNLASSRARERLGE